MDERYFPLAGTATSPGSMKNRKASDLANGLASNGIPHATLVECRISDSKETVVLDVRVEVPSHRQHQILRRERIAATFSRDDDRMPSVEALRKDFPAVPHLNLHRAEYPRNICLYEDRYEELTRSWTAPRFVRRIQEWLSLTSRGELHDDDQRLEPLLVDYAGHIVLPADLATNIPEQLYVTCRNAQGRLFLLAHRQAPGNNQSTLEIVASVHVAEPRLHGHIHRRPATLADVAEIAQGAGLDIVDELRRALPDWKENSLESRVALVLIFPQTRTSGGAVEDHETWCFMTDHTVLELGVGLGIWEQMNNQIATLLQVDEHKQGQDIPVEVLNPCFELTRASAARLNGRSGATDLKMVGVGVGALGSQIVMNLSRSGFGTWTLVDPDVLMPHNVARHALGGNFVGWNKAETVAFNANTHSVDNEAFTGLNVDLLRPGEDGETLEESLSAADAIIDMTASVAVQRRLARDSNSEARRLCVFLNPSGADMVLIAEDVNRKTTLDALEMQYYRALLLEEELDGHIDAASGRLAYARSCGDRTSMMPQDLVALHAAIASKRIKDILAEDQAFVGVWRSDSAGGVQHIEVQTERVAEMTLGTWTVVLDDGLRQRLHDQRDERLPNETGGILLGSFDLERSILYLVGTILSPPDSEERTDLYVRGCEGLSQAVVSVEARTGGMIEYVGEWHSHPCGAGTAPSGYDSAAFGWLTRLMSRDGLPAVMMIVGDGGETSLFVGSMGRDAHPIP